MWYWVRPLASYFLSRLWNIPRVYSHFSEIWKATFNTSVKNTYPWGYCSRPLSPALAPNPFPLQAPAPQPGCKGPRRAGGCRRVGRGVRAAGAPGRPNSRFPSCHSFLLGTECCFIPALSDLDKQIQKQMADNWFCLFSLFSPQLPGSESISRGL